MTTTVPMQATPMVTPVTFHQQELPRTSLNSKAALITGYMQIGLSVGSFTFGTACSILGFIQGNIAIPIWGGLGFYLVAGILGVVAGHSKGHNKCAVVGCLVMSILAAVVASGHLVIGAISSAHGKMYYDYPDPYQYSGKDAVDIISTIVGGIEFVVAIIAAVYMFFGVTCCCGDPAKAQYAYFVQPSQVVQPGQVMMQQYVGHPQVIVQPHVMGQPQVIGQPQQNVQYMSQAQLPAYTEHETKEVPQMWS